jgi:hypothetical protein
MDHVIIRLLQFPLYGSKSAGVLRAFCEGWDTTNLDTDRRVSGSFAKSAKDPDFLLRGPSHGSVCGFL